MNVLLLGFSTLGVNKIYYYIHPDYIYKYIEWIEYDESLLSADSNRNFKNEIVLVDIKETRCYRISDDLLEKVEIEVNELNKRENPNLKINPIDSFDYTPVNHLGLKAITRFVQAEQLGFKMQSIQLLGSIPQIEKYLSEEHQQEYLPFYRDFSKKPFNYIISQRVKSFNQDNTIESEMLMQELVKIEEIEVPVDFFAK